MWKQKYIKKVIIIKDIVLKSLLSFRHVGNVLLNLSAEPISSPKVNSNHLPMARPAKKCNF